MAKYTVPTEYLYATARIRSVEAGLLGRERLTSLLEMRDVEEILTAIRPLGFERVFRADGSVDIEAMLNQVFRRGIDTVKESVPDPQMTAVVEYPYDCHNIKSYLKSNARGIEPADMMIPLGSISPEALLTILGKREYENLPRHMGEALVEAKEAFSKTGDPREIDFLLDIACYKDLMEATAEFPFAAHIVAMRADLTNLSITLRLLRMHSEAAGRVMLEKTLVPGGTLDGSFFAEAYAGGEDKLATMLESTPYSGVFREGLSHAAVEKNADNCVMKELKRATYISFGAEVPLAYLLGLETSVKNLRILLVSRSAGLSVGEIREKVRDSYV